MSYLGVTVTRTEGNDFVVQEYVPVPEEMFPTVGDGSVNMRLKRFNINPFSIGDVYAAPTFLRAQRVYCGA